MNKQIKISTNKKVITSQRPLFNQPSGILIQAIGMIIGTLDTYHEDMPNDIASSFKRDLVIMFNEIANRN